MKIMIGVDDSAHSKAALEYVKSMKWPAGSRFAVLSAARPQVGAYALVDVGAASWVRTAEQEMIKEAEELTSRVERELRQAGLATEAQVVLGDPREAIVDSARSWGADLLVVGSHGRTGLDKLVMGSVASHVVTHAPCSVLVVKLKKP
jgi:nucleotide-binding universal stress UspA family protein